MLMKICGDRAFKQTPPLLISERELSRGELMRSFEPIIFLDLRISASRLTFDPKATPHQADTEQHKNNVLLIFFFKEQLCAREST